MKSTAPLRNKFSVLATAPCRGLSLFRCSEPLAAVMTSSQHVYEVRPRKGKRGVDLISDVLPFGRLWYGGPEAVANAMGQR